MMRPLVLACLFASTSAFADAPGTSFTTPAFDAKAESHLRGGRIMTLLGVAHLVIGGALLAEMAITSSRCNHTEGCRNEMGGIPAIVAGSLLVSSGAVFVASGAPFWAKGAKATERIVVEPSAAGMKLIF